MPETSLVFITDSRHTLPPIQKKKHRLVLRSILPLWTFALVSGASFCHLFITHPH